MNKISNDIARITVQAMEEKKAELVKIIDISEVSVLADYFIICNGSSQPQIDAIIDNVSESLGKAGFHIKKTEGRSNCGWVLMDYGDVVIHVFSREQRAFYDLERIWRDGKFITAEEL